MEKLKSLLENFKERLKAGWAETQETPWFISLKEKYEELPPLGQKAVAWGSLILAIFLVLSWPVSELMDASDSSAKFEERRKTLKELLDVARDVSTAPMLPTPPIPSALKSVFDQKIAVAGVKPEQIKGTSEIPETAVSGTHERGFQIQVQKLTIKQVVDLGYELEHSDPSLKLSSLEILAQSADTHFYDATYKLVNYSPVLAEAGLPGGSLLDAIKGKGGGAPGSLPGAAPGGIPRGQSPAIPNIPGGIPKGGM